MRSSRGFQRLRFKLKNVHEELGLINLYVIEVRMCYLLKRIRNTNSIINSYNPAKKSERTKGKPHI